MFVLLHQEAKLALVDGFNPLKGLGSSHVASTTCQCHLSLPDVVLDLSQLLPVLLQSLLVVVKTPYLGHGTVIMELVYGIVHFRMEVVLQLEEFELSWIISVEGSSGWHGSGLERLDILMGVSIDHPIDEGVFTPFDLDILGRLQLTTR